MKHIVFFFILNVYAYTTFAQPIDALRSNVQTVWGSEYEEPTNASIKKIVATEGGGFYALRERQGGLLSSTTATKPIIEFYNSKMTLVRHQELDLDYKGKTRFLKDVIMIQRRLWLLSYFYNEKHAKTYLFAQEIDKITLKLMKDVIKIGEQDETNRNRTDVFTTALSPDSSKIVVFNQQPNAKQEGFSLAVYNADFTEIWTKNAKLPYKKSNFSVENYQIDNNGNVYLLGIIYTEGSNRLEKHGKATYQYDIVAYRRDSIQAEPMEYKIDLKDRFVSELSFKITNQGELLCAGFFSEKGAKSIKGSCFFKINPTTSSMTTINTREFDVDFMTANLSEKNKQKAKQAVANNDRANEPELFDYSIDHLIPRSDGGVIMVAEQYYIDERLRNTYANNWGNPYYSVFNSAFNSPYSNFYDPYNRSNSNNRPDYYFNYNDIIVINIRPDGEIAWSARIPKRQMSVNDGGINSSYAMSVVADKLYFIYNDDPKNLNPTQQKLNVETPDKYSVVTLAEVNKEGQVHREPLFQNKDKGIVVRPKIGRQVGKRDMTIYGESGRRYRFGVLSFE